MFDFCDFLPRIRNLQKVRMGFVGSSRESWTRMAKESLCGPKFFARLRRVAHPASPYLNHPAPRYSPFSLVTYGPYQVGCRVASP